MRKSGILYLILYCLIIIFIFLQDVSALSGETAPNDPEKTGDASIAEKDTKRGRPDNTLSASYAFVYDRESIFRASADNKIFSLGTLNFYNTAFIEKRVFYDNKVPDKDLYQLSDMIMGQNQDWLCIGMFSMNSDEPFHDRDIIDASAAAGMRIFGSGKHSVFFAVFYTRWNILPYKYNIPIPFLSYVFRGTDVTFSAGFPTMISWQISGKWSFSARYFPVRNIDSSLVFRPLGFINIAAEGIWKTDRYTLADRAHSGDRLFHEYLLGRLSVRSYLNSYSGLFVSAGYLFRDDFLTGEKPTNSRRILSLESAPVFEAGAQIFF